ncbi:Rz-like lysis system protein LysB [Sodalis sp. RH15]|uniref:Rz-like lysis system protein LysB n=1 Tax=Sodalis sp. RH15 TaxID=3394330 RepID=UPI0039B48A54
MPHSLTMLCKTTSTIKTGSLKIKGNSRRIKNRQLMAISLVSAANGNAQRDLRQRAATLQTQLTARQEKIKELINENAELKRWADTRLPVDIDRLRTRPAFTGAAAYRAWLSQSDNLSVSGDASVNQR